jgi:protein-disulfide isomerase
MILSRQSKRLWAGDEELKLMRNDFWKLAATAMVLLGLTGCEKKAEETPPASQTSSASAIPAPSGSDWTEKVSLTPEGGYRMGNPDAPVKLVEYASLTCPHCRDFSRDAAVPLRESYVKSGKLSWEFRSFALNAIDVAATLLATCQGPAPFFKLVEQTYIDQDKWVLSYQQLTKAQQDQLSALAPGQQFAGLAKAGGLDGFYRVRGLPAAKAEACLTDQKKIDAVVAVRDRGIKDDKVEGTPTFIINGTKIDQPPTWTALEPEIKKAGG